MVFDPCLRFNGKSAIGVLGLVEITPTDVEPIALFFRGTSRQAFVADHATSFRRSVLLNSILA